MKYTDYDMFRLQTLAMPREIQEKTWEDFNRCTTGKKIVIFGASGSTQRFLANNKFLGPEAVAYVVDNDRDKWGKAICGIPIKNPKDLSEEDMGSTVVLISSVYMKDIYDQCKSYGCTYIFNKNSFWMTKRIRLDSADEGEAGKVKNILSDQKSKDIFEAILDKRRRHDIDHSDIWDSETPQYFDSTIVHCVENEVFVDGGAYNGDTIKEFRSWAKKGYKKIYAYEADEKNYSILAEFAENDRRVVCRKKALWDREEELSFRMGNGAMSMVEDNGKDTVSAEPLRTEEKVTFIKMDIEGAEMRALEGMKDIIVRDLPKLAVCIYHKYDDLWKIPLYIHTLSPQYKLYVRHYRYDHAETVLYAIL